MDLDTSQQKARYILSLSRPGCNVRLYRFHDGNKAMGYKVACSVYSTGIACISMSATDESACRAAATLLQALPDNTPTAAVEMVEILNDAMIACVAP